MRMPWTKKKELLQDILKRLGKIEKGFSDYFAHFTAKDNMVKEESFKAINIWKKSEQIKYNRIEQRLIALEDLHREEIDAIHQGNLNREMAAAKEIDKRAGL